MRGHPTLSDTLEALNELLSTELAYFNTAFCRDAIFSHRSFAPTCKYNYAFRRWCDEHQKWHVLPARKRKPWRLIEDMETIILDELAADPATTHLNKALWDVRKQHAALFEVLAELEINALNARREQRRLKAKEERSNRQPPRVAAEFIPRVYLIEFATCYRKTGYATVAEAQEAIELLHRKEIESMNVYRCSYCRQHHVGHRPRRKPSPATVYKHAKKYWRDYPQAADRFVVERNLTLG
jgi:hypothetical protein